MVRTRASEWQGGYVRMDDEGSAQRMVSRSGTRACSAPRALDVRRMETYSLLTHDRAQEPSPGPRRLRALREARAHAFLAAVDRGRSTHRERGAAPRGAAARALLGTVRARAPRGRRCAHVRACHEP